MPTENSEVNGLVHRLATWTNVVLIILFLVTVGLVLYPTMAGAVATSAPPAAPAYEAGSTIDTPAEWHEGSAFTLVLFAQAACGACQRARPFLKEIVDEFGADVPVVLVSPGADLGAENRFAESIGLPAATVRRAPSAVRARVTPTLVLVDRAGKVIQAWEGVPPDRQASIRQTVSLATRTRTSGAP